MSRNSDNYKKAFGALHAPDHISLEVDTMERKANKHVALGPALALVAALTLGGAGTAYATDLGGFRTTVNAWLAGEQRTMVAEPIDDGSYEFTVLDGEGNPTGEVVGGGGVEYDGNGNERALSAQEVADTMGVDIVTGDDGRTWLHYYDRSFDITDLVKNGSAKLCLTGQAGTTTYFDLQDNGSDNFQWSETAEPEGPADAYAKVD